MINELVGVTVFEDHISKPRNPQNKLNTTLVNQINIKVVRLTSDNSRFLPDFIRVPGFLAQQARHLREFHYL